MGDDSEREVAGHDPYVEDLGVRYSPADDERCDSATTERLGCRTPDPMCFLDADTMAVIGMLEGNARDSNNYDDDASLLCMEPLTAQPGAPPSNASFELNRSGRLDCFATHPVGHPHYDHEHHDPPLLLFPVQGRSRLKTTRPESSSSPLPPPSPPAPFEPLPPPPGANPFRAVEGNHAGVLSDAGGVRAWMATWPCR